jgi:hypothetical protein
LHYCAHRSNLSPRKSAFDVTVGSSHVAASRSHAAQEPKVSATFADEGKRSDLEKPVSDAAPAAGTPVPTLPWEFRP